MELFEFSNLNLAALPRTPLKLEREIQRLLETNLETVFGIRFLATEFSTGEKHAGRIDSLGIDENGTPVIVEYKLTSSENVINQALYYLDWLVDHKADFSMLVQKKLGPDVQIDWTSPRVLCVADGFGKYDSYAVQQIGRNIELVQYKVFANRFLLVDVVSGGRAASKTAKAAIQDTAIYSVKAHLGHTTSALAEVALEIREYLLGLGEDVTESPVKNYVAYRTTRNFCCFEVHRKHLFLYLSLDPAIAVGCDFCRDMRGIGHFGTGDLELRITDPAQLNRALELIGLAYEQASGGVA